MKLLVVKIVPVLDPKITSDWLVPAESVPVIVKDRAKSLPADVIEIFRGSANVAVPDDVRMPPIVKLPAALKVVATDIPSLSAGVVNIPPFRYFATLEASDHVPVAP